uniref:Uncharacterized protein n=1 Tax=Romanomermis culicivorax TaxID=13658 RepID=A0A915IK73_ROMCU
LHQFICCVVIITIRGPRSDLQLPLLSKFVLILYGEYVLFHDDLSVHVTAPRPGAWFSADVAYLDEGHPSLRLQPIDSSREGSVDNDAFQILRTLKLN